MSGGSTKTERDNSIAINRPLVGVIAVVCLLSSLTIWMVAPDNQMWIAGFVRVGLVMSAFWLALPTRNREAAWANVSPWTFACILLGIVVMVRLPLRIVLPIAVAVASIGFMLRPRGKTRPPRSS